MNALLIFIFSAGLMSSGNSSDSVLDVRVRPGEDVVIYCDCSISPGVLVRWYRNCSHTHQPMLVLKLRTKYLHNLRNDPVSWMTPLPRFQFVKNDSSKSYDIRISNITESDEGLYFCGTETHKLDDDDGSHPQKMYKYVYGNVSTQITLIKSSEGSDYHDSLSHHPMSWVTLVPAAVVLFSNICFILLYHFCQKHDDKLQQRAHRDKDCFSTIVVFEIMDRKNL